VIRRSRAHAGGRSGFAGRHLAIALASLTLIAQLSSFAHLALVRHVVCPEHGELIHPDEQAPSTSSPAVRVVANAAPAEGVAIEAIPEAVGVAVHGHDHCLVAAHRRERATLVPRSESEIVDDPKAVARLATRDVPRPASVALFVLAPKNSPPA
jgi:hypothetical protein